MVLGTCDHLFSVSLPSKKLWYLLVSIAGSLIHLNYDIQSCQVAVLLGSGNPQDEKKKKTRRAKSININKCVQPTLSNT